MTTSPASSSSSSSDGRGAAARARSESRGLRVTKLFPAPPAPAVTAEDPSGT